MKRMGAVLVLAAAALVAAAPEEFSTSAGALRLAPIQHASLMIQAGGKALYMDPADVLQRAMGGGTFTFHVRHRHGSFVR